MIPAFSAAKARPFTTALMYDTSAQAVSIRGN